MILKPLVLISLLGLSNATFRLQEVFSWNVLDWNYPNAYSRQQALASGALIPENALPVGIERWNNKLFVSVPRWKQGIPATLNYIPLDAQYESSPKLTPYPSWEGNQLGECMNGLTTVYRIKADKCDRLWVLDTGTYGYDPNVTTPCPYALNVYDLKTDRRLRRYVFRAEDIVPTTFIANIAVDIGHSCDDAYAYFSDELGYGLIAYSWEQNKSWRFGHNFFMPDPLLGDFNIAGLNFNWGTEGIFGISVSPIGNDGYRSLFFSPLASHTEFSVSTRVLRNASNVPGNYRDFKIVGFRSADSHTTAKVMEDNNGIQLFNLIDQNAIGCWNSARPYQPQNIAVVDRDDIGLVFPSDIKIDGDSNVWVLSDRMPVFLESELDYSDINFRIYTAPLDLLLQGTVCESSAQTERRFPSPKLGRPLPIAYANSLNTNNDNSYIINNLPPHQSLQPAQPFPPYQLNQFSQPAQSDQPNQYNKFSQPNSLNQLPQANQPYINEPTIQIQQDQPLQSVRPIQTIHPETVQPLLPIYLGPPPSGGVIRNPEKTYHRITSQVLQNTVAKTSSYINIPKQISVPYLTQPVRTLATSPAPEVQNTWWQRNRYEVKEH